jgi:20S proteasome alpha/beta subunit
VAAVCSGKGEHLIQPILDEITHMEEDDSLWELSTEGENAFLSGTPGAHDSVPCIPLREESIGDIAAGMSKAGRSTGVATKRRRCVDLNEKDACDLVVRAFRAAAEREISVGDGVEVWVVRKKSRMDELIEGKSGGRKSDSNARLLKRLHFPLPAH